LDGGVRRRQWRRHNFKNYPDSVGMAHGERDHIRPDAGFVDTDRRHSVGIRLLLLDYRHDGPRCRDTQRERDLHAFGHNRLLHGDGFRRRNGEQGDADSVGMAHGERDHLRPDAGFVDIERRHGVGTRRLLLDDARDGTCDGDDQRRRDFHRYGRG